MDVKVTEIAQILDNNIHNKRIVIKSQFLTSNQERFIREFIHSVNIKDKVLR